VRSFFSFLFGLISQWRVSRFGPEDVNVAGILRRIGQLEMNQRKFKQARETLNRALMISTAKWGPDHPNTGYTFPFP